MITIAVLLTLFGIVQSQAAKEVAFSAGVTYEKTYINQETIIYDKVFTNIGGGYDATTGIFTCPQGMDGTYLFQYFSLSHLDANTYLNMYKNADYIQSLFGHSVLDYAEGGNTAILTLVAGDTVQIKAVDPNSGFITNIYGKTDGIYTTFSGYLLG